MGANTGFTSCCVVGYGFIGAHLVDCLVAKGHEVTVLDRKPRPTHVPEAVTWCQLTLPDFEKARSVLANVDVVYFLVASTVPADMNVDLVSEMYQTVIGTIQFVELCKECAVRKIVFTSSASVYGNHGAHKVRESDATNPISAHGIQKLTLEKHLLMERALDKIDTQVFRIANPYGPGQSLTGRQGFIAIVLGNMVSNTTTSLRGDGNAQRDFIYVTEVAAGLAQLGMQSQGPDIVNLGYGEAVTLNHLVDRIRILSDHVPKMKHLKAWAHEIQYSCMDIERAQDAGWAPCVDLDAGLLLTMAHHKIIKPTF